MSKLLKVSLILAFAVGLLGAYRYGAAQEPNVTLAPNHVLHSTFINSGEDTSNGGFVSAAELFPVDSQITVLCPGPSNGGTCSIQADMWIQTGGQSFPDNTYILCLYVDGNPAPNCGNNVGVTLPDGTYSQGSTSEIVRGLTPGDHTVQTKIESGDGAFVGYYNFNYRLYKP